MALNFNVLAQTPSVVQRFMQGGEAAQREADANLMRQRQTVQFEQQQQDRARTMERDQALDRMADLMAQNGLDPDSPDSAQQLMQYALKSRSPQAIQIATAYSERAQKRAQEKAYRTEYERLYGSQAGAPAGAAAAPAGMPPESPQMTSTLISRGVPQPDVAPPAITAAQSFPVAPLAGTPIETPMPSTRNALAPQAPQAKGANALTTPADPFARERAEALALAASNNPLLAQRGKLMLGYIPKLAMPESAGAAATPADIRAMKLLGYPQTRQGYEAFKAAGQRPPGEQQDVALMRQLGIPITPEGFARYQRMRSPEKPVPKMTPAQEAKRRDTLGKEFKSTVSALQTTQEVLDSLTMVKEAPGLARATGFTGVYTPSFSEGEAAQAETRLQNLKGKITALGKAAAATSGAIGSIANQEWKILADQIAAIEPVKGKGPLLEQLQLVEAQAQGAMERIKDAYQRTYGEDFERFPQFADLPIPKSALKGGGRGAAGASAQPSAAGGLSPAEQAELDQLRQQFGRRPQGAQ